MIEEGTNLQAQDETANLRRIHAELVEQFVGREEENKALLAEMMDLYFRFLPVEYLEKYGLRSVDPNTVNDPATRAENKSFNRKLKEKIYYNPMGRDLSVLMPTFARRVVIKSGNGNTEFTVASGVVPITSTRRGDSKVCQISNACTLGELINDGFVELYDDETNDTPCLQSNVNKISDFTRGGQYNISFINDDDDDDYDDDDDDNDEDGIYQFRLRIYKQIQSASKYDAYFHIEIDFEIKRSSWTEDHDAWWDRVLSQTLMNCVGRLMGKDEFDFIRSNFDDEQVERVGILIPIRRINTASE